jgi:hypothetical protein
MWLWVGATVGLVRVRGSTDMAWLVSCRGPTTHCHQGFVSTRRTTRLLNWPFQSPDGLPMWGDGVWCGTLLFMPDNLGALRSRLIVIGLLAVAIFTFTPNK